MAFWPRVFELLLLDFVRERFLCDDVFELDDAEAFVVFFFEAVVVADAARQNRPHRTATRQLRISEDRVICTFAAKANGETG